MSIFFAEAFLNARHQVPTPNRPKIKPKPYKPGSHRPVADRSADARAVAVYERQGLRVTVASLVLCKGFGVSRASDGGQLEAIVIPTMLYFLGYRVCELVQDFLHPHQDC